MPIVSKAQQRWAYWAAEHAKGKTKAAAKDFVAAGPRGGSFKKLPATTGGYSFRRRGLPEPQASYRPGGYPTATTNADRSNVAPVPKVRLGSLSGVR